MRDRAVAIGDGDNGFLEVVMAETDRSQLGAIGRALDALRYDSAFGVVAHFRPPRAIGLDQYEAVDLLR